jgi:catechol 2,3-dioxygenase-like lactoylglutathione lyase family enzyme
MLLGSTIHLTMYCSNPDALRALYEAIRGMMLSSIPRMLAAGFVSVRYLGGGDIMPEAGLLPDDLGVMMRLQKWQVVSQVTAADAAGAGSHESVFVAADDITVNGNTGGVTPVS